MREALRRLRSELETFWTPPDTYLVDAGTMAETLIAQVRLGLVVVLMLYPTINAVVEAALFGVTRVTGLFIGLGAVAVAYAALRTVERDVRRPYLPLIATVLDVSIVSATLLVAALLTSDPHVAVNSRTIFDVYLLAIAATCLRYDVRLSVISGVTAIVQYGLIVLWANGLHDLSSLQYAPWPHGRYSLGAQVSRIILLGAMTGLAVVIVSRLHRHLRQSSSDQLTRLFNRAYFEEFLAAEVRRSKRYSRVFAVAMVDIDRFKVFNDTYGHAAGDQALRTVAATIQHGVRRSDLVARYGGEEMVLVMPETNLGAARKRLETIREAVASEGIKVPKRDEGVRVTVSAGVACWPADGENSDDLLHTADARLFHAKALGRNRVVSSSIAAASV
jgi:two-component system cell cycle response regulator